MSLWRRLLVLFGLLLAAAPAVRAADASGERRVMVMLKLGAEHFRSGGDYGGPYGDVMAEKARLRLARRIARQHNLTVIEAWPMSLIGVDCVIMAVNDARPPATVAATLSRLPGVAWSQPLNQFRMQSSSGGAPAYNDGLFPAQPAGKGWDLAALHSMATGRGVTIAIVDSRIDDTHPDLAGRVTNAPDFAAGGTAQAERHGTGVAGIIAAQPNNEIGIAGVAPGAHVLGLRACWERVAGGATVCDSLSLAKALTYALDHRADVINLSLTGPNDRLLETLVALAVRRNIIVVAAVDRQQPASSFPAFVAGVLPVSDARLPSGEPAVYIAPGIDVPTTEPNGKWAMVSGSSFAAAHVSGLAALLHQVAGPRAHGAGGAGLLGPPGPIDACAMLARVSRLEHRCAPRG